MSGEELYEATRGVWRLSPRRENAKYAFAVGDGEIREVYEITQWQPAGTATYLTRDRAELPLAGRWEFVGEIASGPIREKYIGQSVESYFKKGEQAPVKYLNC